MLGGGVYDHVIAVICCHIGYMIRKLPIASNNQELSVRRWEHAGCVLSAQVCLYFDMEKYGDLHFSVLEKQQEVVIGKLSPLEHFPSPLALMSTAVFFFSLEFPLLSVSMTTVFRANRVKSL